MFRYIYFPALLWLWVFASRVLGQCASNWLIDDFSKFSSNLNSLNAWTSDDGSMSSMKANSGVLSITPKAGGYFYENFPCKAAATEGFNALKFVVKGPIGGSFGLELQTQTSCSSDTQQHGWYLVQDLTGSSQTITIPWTSWSGVNSNAISSIAWYGFSSNSAEWQLSKIELVCSTGSAASQNSAFSSQAPSSPAVSSSVQANTDSNVVRSSALSSLSAQIAGPTTLRTITSSSSSKFSSVNKQSSSLSRSSSTKLSSSPLKSSSSRRASSTIRASSPMRVQSSIRSSSSSIKAGSSATRSSVPTTLQTMTSSSINSNINVSKAGQSAIGSSTTVASSSSGLSRASSSFSTIASPSSSTCSGNLLIEDFTSQSRFKFLNYNALLQAQYDDGTMQSITLDPSNARATFTPKDQWSYWYSQLKCTNALNKYGGISMKIKAPSGTSMIIQMVSVNECGGSDVERIDVSSQSLGWTFDGTEKLYSFKFASFPGLDVGKIQTILIAGFKNAITLGPISMYCGDTASEYVNPSSSGGGVPSHTVAAPRGSASVLLVDDFSEQHFNNLGQWHGGDQDSAFTWSKGAIQVNAQNPDFAFYSQLAGGTCKDMTPYEGSYLHIKYSGSTAFTIAMQQHNKQCDNNVAPFPETWDEVEAKRYASSPTDIYVPLSHFKIEKSRTVGFAFKSWYKKDSTTISLVEIVPSVPDTVQMQSKLPTGNLVFNCKRPNSFAFCIDDGTPAFAQRVMQIIKDADVKVTFFAVGAPLTDPSTNLSSVYKDMLAQGHQLALHSFTHPRMEGLPDYNAIDWEYQNNLAILKEQFGIHSTYMRPPFGNEGARMRYRWTQAAGSEEASIVNWSVDVEDWKWAQTPTPEKQLEAFKNSVDRGGNLAVLHYLYESTVDYLPEFIAYAKAAGKQIMRLDQCMEDPLAPPL